MQVVITDYPDQDLINNMLHNVIKIVPDAVPSGVVEVRVRDWECTRVRTKLFFVVVPVLMILCVDVVVVAFIVVIVVVVVLSDVVDSKIVPTQTDLEWTVL